MSQVTATTTAPPLMVCSNASSVTTSVTMAPSGLTSTGNFSSAGCGSVAIADNMGPKGCCMPHHCPAVAALVPDAFWGIWQLYCGSATGPFLFHT